MVVQFLKNFIVINVLKQPFCDGVTSLEQRAVEVNKLLVRITLNGDGFSPDDDVRIYALGDQLFTQHLNTGVNNIAELNPEAAVEALQLALTIKPEASDALAAMRRAEQLPEIIGKLRSAKNHELGGRFKEALDEPDLRTSSGLPQTILSISH